ncbi:MAG: acetyl-CoA carboxylase biotin carboxyl carrier protein [Planctomycetes bacterium]|nr:acetyl-CoA carboxylase biotin carboxyl carrier protein [Planctomycetota bacterium]
MAKAKEKAKKAPCEAPRRRTPEKPSDKAGPGDADRLHTRQVQELVELMVANDLATLEIVNGDLKVALSRAGGAPLAPAATMPALLQPPAEQVPAVEKAHEKPAEITSPMVGTFYSAPSPDSDPYVSVGTPVSPDTVVCIVEAMKVMNEIRAECSGTILQVAVTSGEPVEYGQALFHVKP